MKYIYILFFIFSINTSNAQIKTLKAIYGAFHNSSAEEIYQSGKNREDLIEMFNKEEAVTNKLNFILEYSQNQSFFYHPEYRTMGFDDFMGALSTFDGHTKFYSDAQTGKLLTYYPDFWGRELIIYSDQKDFIWELKDVHKEIDGYKCYKAEGTLISHARGYTTTNKVVAWYCPKISISSGPIGYGQLPGLIFELSVGYRTYLLKSLEINPNLQPIIFPTNGTKLTQKEFEEKKENFINEAKLQYQQKY